MSHRRTHIKRTGFTLIELLVVIAMIALLMAILIPALSRVRKQARAMVCQSRLRQWGTVLPLYAQDNEGRFPCNVDGSAGAWLLRGALLSTTSKDPNVASDSFYHFRTKDIVCCPTATRAPPVAADTTSSETGSLPATFMLPPGTVNGTVGLDYSPA